MPPPDFSLRKDVRKVEKAAEVAERQRIDYTKRIMSEAAGRAWMHNLLERCHVFHTPFVRNAPDLTAFNCGEQNVGYQTFADVVTHCASDYILMMQEANLKDFTNGRRNDPATEHPGSPDPNGRTGGSEPDLDPAVWREADEYGTLPGGTELP